MLSTNIRTFAYSHKLIIPHAFQMYCHKTYLAISWSGFVELYILSITHEAIMSWAPE